MLLTLRINLLAVLKCHYLLPGFEFPRGTPPNQAPGFDQNPFDMGPGSQITQNLFLLELRLREHGNNIR